MKELMEPKRWALATALVYRQIARAFEDGAEMLIRVVQKMNNKAKEMLDLRVQSRPFSPSM
jgi:hypothetical protein